MTRKKEARHLRGKDKMSINTKDKMFLLVVIVVSVIAGMLLMVAINNYKNQEEVNAAETGLSAMKVHK